MHCSRPPLFRPRAQASHLAIRVWFLLAGAALLFGTAEPARSAGAPPSGLVIVRKITNTAADDRNLTTTGIENASVSGVAVQIGWRDIEPKNPATGATPNWDRLDSIFKAAQSKNKWVALLIFAGFYAPHWAYPSPAPMFTPEYGPLLIDMRKKNDVHALPMPLPWDQTYLNNWFAFLTLVKNQYAPYDNFRMIAADGPTSVSVEMTLPGTEGPSGLRRWIGLGYTPEKYENAYESVFTQYQALFKNQYIVLTLGDAPNIACSPRSRGTSKCRPAAKSGPATRLAIVADAVPTFGSQLVLQNSSLKPGDSRSDFQFVTTYSGRVITGLQMGTTYGASVLQSAITLGTRPNSAGCRVNYLEIYQDDFINKDGTTNAATQPALKKGVALTSSQLPTCVIRPITLPSGKPIVVPTGNKAF